MTTDQSDRQETMDITAAKSTHSFLTKQNLLTLKPIPHHLNFKSFVQRTSIKSAAYEKTNSLCTARVKSKSE